MVMMKILFLILITACIFFRILYIWDFSVVLLIISCVLPMVFFISLRHLKHNLKIDFSVSEKTAEKDKPFTVTLNVENKTIFPVAKAEAVIEYQNTVNGDVNEVELYFPIQSRNAQKIDFQLTSKFCGKIKVRTDFVMIYDPIRLFKTKTAKNIETEIIIMPSCHEINGYIGDYHYIDEESTMFSQTKSGDDPSEVFDFREYKNGDKPARIHWKLSSKKDEFIVKDLSMPINEKTMLFPDIRCYENSEYTLPVFDTLMETLMSLSMFLLENEQPHYIIEYANAEFNYIYINDIKVLYDFMLKTVSNANIKSDENPIEKFIKENPEMSCSSFTYISHETDKEILSHLESSVISDIKNVIYVSKDSQEKDMPDFDELNIITVTAGKITSSTEGIEL